MRGTTILTSLEFLNCSFGSDVVVKTNDARTARTATRLVLDLCLLDIADGAKEFDEIVVAGGPRQLSTYQHRPRREVTGSTHVSDENNLITIAVSSREIGESVGSRDRGRRATEACSCASCRATLVATTATLVATTACKAATLEASPVAAAESAATAEATAHSVGKSVDPDFEDATIPIVAVELLDGVASVV